MCIRDSIGVGAGDAIGGQTQVQLEATERLFGVSTEDGIAGALEEPERAQRLLQLKHVVPMEVGHAQIQRAVAQIVGGVYQRLSLIHICSPARARACSPPRRPPRHHRAAPSPRRSAQGTRRRGDVYKRQHVSWSKLTTSIKASILV